MYYSILALTEDEFNSASASAKLWLMYEVLIEIRDILRKINDKIN